MYKDNHFSGCGPTLVWISLATFSIRPSHIFFLQTQVIEEETEKKVLLVIGFITGQLKPHAILFLLPGL